MYCCARSRTRTHTHAYRKSYKMGCVDGRKAIFSFFFLWFVFVSFPAFLFSNSFISLSDHNFSFLFIPLLFLSHLFYFPFLPSFFLPVLCTEPQYHQSLLRFFSTLLYIYVSPPPSFAIILSILPLVRFVVIPFPEVWQWRRRFKFFPFPKGGSTFENLFFFPKAII
jgi:hypothetical protein